MMTAGQILAVILVTAAATLLTRAAPFIFFGGSRPTPGIIVYLGRVLPPAVMAMLIVYALRDASILSYPYGLPELMGIATVTCLHLWRRNTLLSIMGGTAVYMLAVQLIFA